MDAIGIKVKAESGFDLMEGMDIQARPYGGIYGGHYKFGCFRCTRVHEHGPCPETLADAESSPNNSSLNSSQSDNSLKSAENSPNAAGGISIDGVDQFQTPGNSINNEANSSQGNGSNGSITGSVTAAQIVAGGSGATAPLTAPATQPLQPTVLFSRSPMRPGSPLPQIIPPTRVVNEDPSISGHLRTYSESRNRSSSAKRTQENVDGIIGDSLEKKKKTVPEPKKGHQPRSVTKALAKI